jgi:hypothetical protein
MSAATPAVRACKGLLALTYAATGGCTLANLEVAEEQWAKNTLPEWMPRFCGVWQCATAAALFAPAPFFSLGLIGSGASVGAVYATWLAKQKNAVQLSTFPEPAIPLAINTGLGVATAVVCAGGGSLGFLLGAESFLAGGITILCEKWVTDFFDL